MVEVFCLICIIGVLLAIFLPAFGTVQEAVKRRDKELRAIKGVNNTHLFTEIFSDQSHWTVSEKDREGLKPLILTNTENGMEVIILVNEDMKGDQIFVNGKLWPKDTPVSTIFADKATEPAVKAEKE